MRLASLLLVSLFACGALACGGEMPSSSDSGVSLPPTLTRVEAELFAISCNFSACHNSGPTAMKGLELTGKTHAKIVNVMSVEKPGTVLIAPGRPDDSFLLDKMLNRNLPMAPQGEAAWTPMPFPLGGVEADRIELLRAWIAAGAKDD